MRYNKIFIGRSLSRFSFSNACKKTVLLLYGLWCSGAAAQLSFTVNNLSPTFSITCANPAVSLQAVSDYTAGNLSYAWSGPSFSSTASAVTLTSPGNYTIIVSDPVAQLSSSQTVAIGINTTVPNNTVSPISQTVNCNAGSISFTGTATSPNANVQHEWYSPLNPLPGGVPIQMSSFSVSILQGNIPPGVYTLQTTNMVNGCKSNKTFTVTSLSAFPSFGVSSPTNFSLGCVPLNQSTLCIVNPVSTQTPPATTSYTILAPTFTGSLPNGPLGVNTCTVLTMPGNWTVVVQDNSNLCRTELWVPITQNTTAPQVQASMVTQTLLCKTPTILATGSSSTSNTTIEWLVPLPPPNNISSHTLVIGSPSVGPAPGPNSNIYASYTVVATNTMNSCVASSVVPIYQNFKPPISNPKLAVGSPTILSCNSSPVVITVGNSSVTSGIPGAFASVLLWQGPVPQNTASGVSSYSAFIPGVYSLTIIDSQNGCTKTGTIYVSQIVDPVEQITIAPMAPSCPTCCNASVTITPPAGFTDYTATSSSGTLSGNPPVAVNGLCIGSHTLCFQSTANSCTSCQQFSITMVSAVTRYVHENSFTIYPNPAGEIFFVRTADRLSGALIIYDAAGKRLMSTSLTEGQELRLSYFDSGVYFIELQTRNGIQRQKLVVIKN